MKTKMLQTVALMGAGALALSACGGSSDGGGGGGGGDSDTLTIAIQSWMGDKLGLNAMAKKFEEDHGVTVKLVEYADNDALSNFALRWKTGSADQDMVVVDGASTAVQFLEQGLIIDFNETDLLSGDLAPDKFVGEALNYNQKDGVQFSIPIGLETYNISANKTFFEEADLLESDGSMPVPADWNELYDLAAALHEHTGKPGMTIQWGPNAGPTMFSVEQALRGDLYKEDGVTLTFDTPEMREVLPIWKKGVDEGVFSIDTFTNKDAGRSNYNAGGLPMLLETAAHVPEAAPDIGEENAVLMPMPGSLENGSFGFSAGIVIPKATENQDLALQFIAEAVMTDLQIDPAMEWGKLPVLTEQFDKIDADWTTDMYETLKLSVPAPMYPDLPRIQEQIKERLQQYLTGNTEDPTEFLEGLQDMIDNANLGLD